MRANAQVVIIPNLTDQTFGAEIYDMWTNAETICHTQSRASITGFLSEAAAKRFVFGMLFGIIWRCCVDAEQ